MSLSVGDKLGPYEMIAQIGEGGMGEVWKARDARLNRVAGLKQLKATIQRVSSKRLVPSRPLIIRIFARSTTLGRMAVHHGWGMARVRADRSR
jgi:serine/threonine protein kinase